MSFDNKDQTAHRRTASRPNNLAGQTQTCEAALRPREGKMQNSQKSLRLALLIVAIGAAAFSGDAYGQTPPPPDTSSATPDNAILLTVILRHDQSRPVGELNAQSKRQGFYTEFPPAGIEVVSWNVAMGIGQIITLRLPASRLREVNRVFETTAWGAYRTEFYPTYDYKAVGLARHANPP
jgi:hypothetical protein